MKPALELVMHPGPVVGGLHSVAVPLVQDLFLRLVYAIQNTQRFFMTQREAIFEAMLHRTNPEFLLNPNGPATWPFQALELAPMEYPP